MGTPVPAVGRTGSLLRRLRARPREVFRRQLARHPRKTLLHGAGVAGRNSDRLRTGGRRLRDRAAVLRTPASRRLPSIAAREDSLRRNVQAPRSVRVTARSPHTAPPFYLAGFTIEGSEDGRLFV